jgi:hypothetical protein
MAEVLATQSDAPGRGYGGESTSRGRRRTVSSHSQFDGASLPFYGLVVQALTSGEIARIVFDVLTGSAIDPS